MGECEKLRPYVGTLLRLGLGVVFIYHGYSKVFGGAGLGTSWMPAEAGMPAVVQGLVAWGELVGGVAILIGFLTKWASLGIIVIMAGAIVTVHGKNGFSMMNQGFEYNFVLITMCLALIASGSGALSVGCCKKK